MSGDRHWLPVKISELIRESRIKGSNGSNARKLTIRLYGRGIVASSDRGGSEATNYYIRKAGQFAYSKLDCLNGAFGIIPPHLDGYETTLDLPTFDFVGEVDPSWFLKTVARPSFYGRFKFAAIGSRKANRVPTEEFLATRLSLPPLAEQRAIAEVLGAVETSIAKAEALCTQLYTATETLTEALLQGIDPRTGDQNSDGWRPSNLATEMASIQVGIVVKPASYYVDADGVPALRSLNVRPNRLFMSDLIQISQDGHKLNAKSALRAGDVVTVRTGEPGKTAVVPAGIDEMNCIDVIFSRPGSGLRGEYVSFFMNSRIAKRQIAVLQGGLAQQHLNVGEMKRIKIFVPPLNYQDKAVDLLNEAWMRIEVEEATLEQIKSLRAALAQELLSGRIRLPESLIARHRGQAGQAT